MEPFSFFAPRFQVRLLGGSSGHGSRYNRVDLADLEAVLPLVYKEITPDGTGTGASEHRQL